MTTSTSAAVAVNDVTENTLGGVPARTLKFLEGAGAPGIRSALAGVGWNATHIDEAWALLTALKATHVVAPPPQGDSVLEAINACETWQATSFVRARARLTLTFPDQATFLFADITPGKGMEAVLNVATFLARRHTLASGTGRKATRKVDHEALAFLEKTGITKEEIARLGGLVGKAHDVVVPDDTQAEEAKRLGDERLVILRKLYAWLTAWSEIARTVVTRRDQLIRLGLAKRRASSSKASTTPVPPPVVASPAPPPVATPAPPAVTPAPPVEVEAAPESYAV